jgi:hypothetical protein
MTQEEVMQIMTDMGLHEGGMANWVADNSWWTFANVVAQHEREACAKLIKAAQGVLEWTEIAHRPPLREQLEVGRTARVRLHALADLSDALAANGIKEGAYETN